VLRAEWLTTVLVGNPRFAIGQILEREVGRVAAVAPRVHVAGLGRNAFQQRVDRHAGPHGVELGPLGDAVDIDVDDLRGQPDELLPRPRGGLVHLAVDREAPLVQRRLRGRPGGEHGKPSLQVLTGWEAAGIDIGPSASEPA
jgi:hypothetical protein